MKTAKTKTPRAWPEHFLHRLRRLRKKMRQVDLDGMLITHPPDIHYLSGFDAEDSWLWVTRRSVLALTDRRFERALEETCPHLRAEMRQGPIHQALAPHTRSARRIGLQAEHVSLLQRRRLRSQCRKGKIVETNDWLMAMRAVKDPSEIRSIRRAITLQEAALKQTLKQLNVGMSERSLAGLLEYHMRDMGADGVGFQTIVAVGPNAAKPHHRPGATKIRRNVPILIDFGAKYRGYCGDLTRVFCIGHLSKRMEQVYQIVADAEAAGIAAVRAGVGFDQVDQAARQVIEKAGYGKNFGHSIGHGVGLEVHEQPFLGAKATGPLEEGMVITIEPGIYLPGIGGVRIEDDILVTANGYRRLSSLPTDLRSAII